MHWKSWLVVAAFVGVCMIAAHSRSTRSGHTPQRFPTRLVQPGPLPALWIFARADCVHCRRHLQALQRAARGLPDSVRAQACARVHVASDLQLQACGCGHPLALQRQLGIRGTPLTWWVAADTSIQRAWRGARDEAAWTRALSFLLDPESTP